MDWGMFVVLVIPIILIITELKRIKEKMAANKDELVKFRNELNAAIDEVVKVVEALKAEDEDVTVAEIQEALQGPLDRLVELGKPVV